MCIFISSAAGVQSYTSTTTSSGDVYDTVVKEPKGAEQSAIRVRSPRAGGDRSVDGGGCRCYQSKEGYFSG